MKAHTACKEYIIFRYGLKFSVDVPLFDWEKKQRTLMLVAYPIESMRSKRSVQIVAIEAR